jgi:hypothetical protein
LKQRIVLDRRGAIDTLPQTFASGIADVDLVGGRVWLDDPNGKCTKLELRNASRGLSLRGDCGTNVFDRTYFEYLPRQFFEGRFIELDGEGERLSVDVSNVDPENASAALRFTVGDDIMSYRSEAAGVSFRVRDDRCGELVVTEDGSDAVDGIMLEIKSDSKAANCPVFEAARRRSTPLWLARNGIVPTGGR